MKQKLKVPTWVLTLVLCALTIAGTLAAFLGIYFYEIGLYSYNSSGYLRLPAANAALHDASWSIATEYDEAQKQGLEDITDSPNIQYLMDRFTPENSNILYVLFEPDEDKVLFSNFPGWDPAENITHEEFMYGTKGYHFSADGNDYDTIGSIYQNVSFGRDGYVYVYMAVRNPQTATDVFTTAKAQFNAMTRYAMLPYIVIAISIIAFIVVCILWGRRVLHGKIKQTLFANIVRLLPADLMLVIIPGGAIVAAYGTVYSLGNVFRSYMYSVTATPGAVISGVLCCLSFMLLCLGYLYMLLLQRKEKRVLRNTLIGRIAWQLRRADTRLPTIVLFGVLVLAFVVSTVTIVAMALNYYSIFALLMCMVAVGIGGGCLSVAIYGTWCANSLAKAAKQVAGGNYHIEIEKAHLFGPYREIAEQLEGTTNGLQKAVYEQMKSERMKTELITNVSHDIKTPLTSIVNYVDLLGRLELDDEQAAEYLEVLERQSLRLKKLAEDIVEASRAASGDMSIELAPVDVGELLRQAVAEYAERYEAKNLECVVNAESTNVLADGSLLWRVMDNLLGNAEKYAMPGTRVYIDVNEDNENNALVRITLRNISAQALNISADELMERFVRGDASRTENGSGLGLSISRSLVNIQGGEFELTVDGDLFKVSLWLPKA